MGINRDLLSPREGIQMRQEPRGVARPDTSGKDGEFYRSVHATAA